MDMAIGIQQIFGTTNTLSMCTNETNAKSKIMRSDDAFTIGDTSLTSNGQQPGGALVQNTAKHGGTKNELVEGKHQPTNFKEISLILTFCDHMAGRI